MIYHFDEIINRRGTHSVKHDIFDPDVLALWVADMDFPAPEPVVQSLRERVEHRIFGYSMSPPELKAVLCQRMADLYGWEVQPEQIISMPGVVAGLKTAIRIFGRPGSNVLMQPPVYPPFFSAPQCGGQTARSAPLTRIQDGNRLHYTIDFDTFEAAIDAQTKVFLLCSPHNPSGRVWTRDELTRMAEICEKHDILICSDEIHCDLIFEGHRHIPIAALSPEVSRRTITLMAPSKTYNLPSMGFAFAIIQDEAVRAQFQTGAEVLAHVGVMGYTAALAAYRDGQPWLDAVLAYLQANRDFVTQFVTEHLPGLAITHPEGTYLSWLDCREYLHGESKDGEWIDPFFLEHAKVALNAGKVFGEGGEGFVRLNFACPRAVLTDALHRMRAAVTQA